MNQIAQDFLSRLKCPHCHNGRLVDSGEATLVCDVCGRAYPVTDGVPDLLPDSAQVSTQTVKTVLSQSKG
ncbi:MAG: Trm112 family protein [Capsulimonadaceae bacterium]|nr:Trm112 family protein [Capsulimonadaceae bacterium]